MKVNFSWLHNISDDRFKLYSWWIAVPAFICYCFTLWGAYSVPVYVDEPQWKLTASRLFLDGGGLIYLFPGCRDGWILPVPWSWYPGRILDSWVYQDSTNPIKLRTYGWSVFVGLTVLWSVMLHWRSGLNYPACITFVISVFSIGVLPYVMVFNRPEQSILLWLSLGLFIMMLVRRREKYSTALTLLLTGIFGLLGCLIVAAHPKGVYFLPVLLICWWHAFHLRFLGILLSCIYLWSAFETVKIWSLRVSCKESEWLTDLMKSFTVQPHLLLESPQKFFEEGLSNIYRWPMYVQAIFFQNDYQSVWLNSPIPITSLSISLNAFVYLILTVCILLIIFNLGGFELSRRKRSDKYWLLFPIICIMVAAYFEQWALAMIGIAYVVTPMYSGGWAFAGANEWKLIPISIMTSLCILVFMQTLKNFYEAGIFWPLILLAVIFSFKKREYQYNRAVFCIILPILLMVTIYSEYGRYFQFHGVLYASKSVGKEIIQAQNEIAVFAGEKCNINSKSSRLMLDDMTYNVFWKNPHPMFGGYIIGWWGQGLDVKDTLRHRDPGGLIMQCSLIPDGALKNGLVQENGLCCASKAMLQNYSSH